MFLKRHKKVETAKDEQIKIKMI